MAPRDLVAFSLSRISPLRKGRLIGGLSAWPAGDPDLLELLLDITQAGEIADALRARADRALDEARALGLEAIGRFDAGYPARLARILDAPPVLWVRGQPVVLTGRSVAIVGSRAASTYGLQVAERLAFDLARAGVAIVSGMARGCDGAAHRGALGARGPTVAVLGCGADVVYPSEHAALYRDLTATGAAVSELPPGTPPLPMHFPLRNRLISGLSQAVIVVEASERSGSLITAGCALEQGRDVMAVPGSVFGSRHIGCHGLLRDGACLVHDAGDVLAALGWAGVEIDRTSPDGRPSAEKKTGLLGFMAPGEDCDLDTLVARSGLSPQVVLSRLTELELAGSVRRAGGGRYLRPARQ